MRHFAWYCSALIFCDSPRWQIRQSQNDWCIAANQFTGRLYAYLPAGHTSTWILWVAVAVSKVHHRYSVEPFHYLFNSKMVYGNYQGILSRWKLKAANNRENNGTTLFVRFYVRRPWGMTPLSLNTVAGLVLCFPNGRYRILQYLIGVGQNK